MKKIKNLTLTVVLMMMPFIVNAQNASEESDGFRAFTFVQAQGGLHLPFTSGPLSDRMKPNFSFNVGHWFAPGIGARFGVEGFRSGNDVEKFNYYGFNIDGLFNLSPLFAKRNDPKFNFYLLGGIGLNYQTKHESEARSNKSNIAHNLRVGAGVEYRIFKPLSVSLEFRANNTTDFFPKGDKGSNDWFSSLLVGVSYNFGYSKKVWNNKMVANRPVITPTLSEQRDMAVSDRMKTWMKRMKGESRADYMARTTDEAIETQRLAFGRDFATETAMTRGQGIVGGNARYNEGIQALAIDPSDNMPSIFLSMPKSDAEKLDVKNLRFENTKYEITTDNKYEIIYTEALDTKTGQKYIYNKANATLDAESGFIALGDYQLKAQEAALMANNAQLAVQTNAAQQVDEKTYNLKNTSVVREVQSTTNPNGTSDYTVSYKYSVKDEFSVNDDFPVGQYDAEKTAASRAMLNLIKKQMEEDFAKYIAAGKSVEIVYRGTADAKPIKNGIPYNGKYGDIKSQPVTVNGKPEALSVTKAAGITSNKQLSLLRAISVQKYINKNVTSLKDMNVKESYNVEVFPNEGGQYRRVSVDFIFHNTNL